MRATNSNYVPIPTIVEYESTPTRLELLTQPYAPPPLPNSLFSQVYARRKDILELIQVKTSDFTQNEDVTQISIDDRLIALRKPTKVSL